MPLPSMTTPPSCEFYDFSAELPPYTVFPNEFKKPKNERRGVTFPPSLRTVPCPTSQSYSNGVLT